MPILKKFSLRRDSYHLSPHPARVLLVKGAPMAADDEPNAGTSRTKFSREVPKSTYVSREVPYAAAFVDRHRFAQDTRVANKAREARILATRGMRQTELGPDFRREPRGRHAELPHLMVRAVSRWHDYSCRVCEPSTLRHASECRRCTPMAAWALGAHKLQPSILNYLPVTMTYVKDCYRNSYENIPLEQLEDSWRIMKIKRKERAARQNERTLHW